jgi:hypothetical protein
VSRQRIISGEIQVNVLTKTLRLNLCLFVQRICMAFSSPEIRAKILRLHYDLEMKNPLDRFNTDTLKDVFPDIPENLLDANLVYLYESGLLECRSTPIMTRITPQGINVVENPSLASQYQIDVQVLQIGVKGYLR